MRRSTHPAWQMLTLGCVVVLSGCSNPDSAVGFNEVSPYARFRAIHQAAVTRDPKDIGPLINRLDSDDPAERMLAIRTLEKITGQTLGYDHAADRASREAAVQRWVRWYADRQNAQGASPPTASAASRRE